MNTQDKLWVALLTAALTFLFGVVALLIKESVVRHNSAASLAHAIAAELDGLLSRYLQITGTHFSNPSPDNPTEQFEHHSNYFVVFDSNAKDLGLLRPVDATEITRTYIRAKGHFDTLMNVGLVPLAHPLFEGMRCDYAALTTDVPKLVKKLRTYKSFLDFDQFM